MASSVSCPVSVILPTCGRRELLQEAVESVFAQTLLPGELVVVADGSSQATAALVQRLARSAPLPVSLLPSPRRGAAAARNAGLSRARFPLIAFLDDDDLWKPGKLAAQIAFLEQRPEAGLLACAWEEFGPGLPSFCPPRKPRRDRRIPLARFCLKNPIATSGVILRRECLQAVGLFDESLPLAQDWDLWLRLASRFPVFRLGEPLIRYRRHARNHSLRTTLLRQCENQLLEKAWRELPAIRRRPRLLLLWRLLWSRRRVTRQRRRELLRLDMETIGREPI